MTLDEALPKVLEKLSEFLGRPVDASELASGSAEIGADSMDMIALTYEIEEFSNRSIWPETFMKHATIRAALEEIFT